MPPAQMLLVAVVPVVLTVRVRRVALSGAGLIAIVRNDGRSLFPRRRKDTSLRRCRRRRACIRDGDQWKPAQSPIGHKCLDLFAASGGSELELRRRNLARL